MSETTPDTGTDTPTPEAEAETGEPAPQPDTGNQEEQVDWKAEAEKFKALHRKQEERAKANAAAAKQLETLRRESMTEQEKAVAEAVEKARSETMREFGGRLVEAEVRAAVAARPVDAEALLEGLDRSRFLTDDGEPDRDAIAKWVDRIAPAPSDEDSQPTQGFPDLGQGARRAAPDKSTALNGDPLMRDLKSKLGIR